MSTSDRRVDFANSNFVRYHFSKDFGTGRDVEDEVVPNKNISPIRRPVNGHNYNGLEERGQRTDPPAELGRSFISSDDSLLCNDVRNFPLCPNTFNPVIDTCAKEAQCRPHLEQIKAEIIEHEINSEKFYELYQKGANRETVCEDINKLLTRNWKLSTQIRQMIPQINMTEDFICGEPYPENGEYSLWGKVSWTAAWDQIFANKKDSKKDDENGVNYLKPLSVKLEDQLETLTPMQYPMFPKPNKSKFNEPINSESSAKCENKTLLANIVALNCNSLRQQQAEISTLRQTVQDIQLTMCKMNLNTVSDQQERSNDRSATLLGTVNDAVDNSGFLNSHHCEQALNDQVPPGTRSNNYVDNFRSCALQNDFDTTATASLNQNAACSSSTSPPVVVNHKPVDLSSSDVNLFQNIHNEDYSFRIRNNIVTPNFHKELNIITTAAIETNTDLELNLINDDGANTGVENECCDLANCSDEFHGFEFISNPAVDENLLVISTSNEELLKKSKARTISEMVSTFLMTNKEHPDFLIRLFSELRMLSFSNKSRTELIKTLDALRSNMKLEIVTVPTSSDSDSNDLNDEDPTLDYSDDDGINDSYNSNGDFTN